MTTPKYLYRVQVRQSPTRFWQTKYAVGNRAQAFVLYEGVNIGNGWMKRLMFHDECLHRAESV